MRSIPQEFLPVRAHYAALFFAAMRDSLQPIPALANEPTTAQRYICKQTGLRRDDARDWMRERSMKCSDTEGDGFGQTWSVMEFLGTAFVPLDEFLSTMEDVWKRGDRDPKFARHIIDKIIQPALRLGIVDVYVPGEFDGLATSLDEEEETP